MLSATSSICTLWFFHSLVVWVSQAHLYSVQVLILNCAPKHYATKWHDKIMQRVYKTRYFQRWMRKTELTDQALRAAVQEMSQGLIDADLGGGVVKKRIGVEGRGKSSGVRTLVATNQGDCWFFVFGFAKNARSNITETELNALQALSSDLLKLNSSQLSDSVANGLLQEISHDQQDASQKPHTCRRTRSGQ